jgi:predicted O-methyltransferase YrrM
MIPFPVDWRSLTVPGGSETTIEHEALEKWCQEVYDRCPNTLAIEVGSYEGRSTIVMAQFWDTMAIDVWAVFDLERNSNPEKFDHFGEAPSWKVFMERVRTFGFSNRIFPTCATSKYLDKLDPLNSEFIFVDADHAYPACYEDAVRADRHLSETGWLIFHDYKRPGYGYGEEQYHPTPERPYRSTVDPWAGVAISVDKFMETHDYEVVEQIHGIIALKRK